MKRTDPYTGPFPRTRHSHRCKGCESFHQYNAVACYKSQCSRPQLTETCSWCNPTKHLIRDAGGKLHEVS